MKCFGIGISIEIGGGGGTRGIMIIVLSIQSSTILPAEEMLEG